MLNVARRDANELTTSMLGAKKRAENDKVKQQKGQPTSVELRTATRHILYKEKCLTLQKNPPTEVADRIRSFRNPGAWFCNRKPAAMSEFKAVGGFIEGVEPRKGQVAQVKEWAIQHGYFPSQQSASNAGASPLGADEANAAQ